MGGLDPGYYLLTVPSCSTEVNGQKPELKRGPFTPVCHNHEVTRLTRQTIEQLRQLDKDGKKFAILELPSEPRKACHG